MRACRSSPRGGTEASCPPRRKSEKPGTHESRRLLRERHPQTGTTTFRLWPRRGPAEVENSGAKEDVLSLKHFHGKENCRKSIETRGSEKEDDGVPEVCPGNEFLTDQDGVQHRDEREFRSKLDARHDRRDRWNDDQERQRGEVALRFLVRFGKQSDSHQDSGKQNRQRKGHTEDRDHRSKTQIQIQALLS